MGCCDALVAVTDELEQLRAKVAELETALREAKEAMSEARYSGTPYTSKYSRAIAKINKVLGEE